MPVLVFDSTFEEGEAYRRFSAKSFASKWLDVVLSHLLWLPRMRQAVRRSKPRQIMIVLDNVHSYATS